MEHLHFYLCIIHVWASLVMWGAFTHWLDKWFWDLPQIYDARQCEASAKNEWLIVVNFYWGFMIIFIVCYHGLWATYRERWIHSWAARAVYRILSSILLCVCIMACTYLMVNFQEWMACGSGIMLKVGGVPQVTMILMMLGWYVLMESLLFVCYSCARKEVLFRAETVLGTERPSMRKLARSLYTLMVDDRVFLFSTVIQTTLFYALFRDMGGVTKKAWIEWLG